MSKKKKAALVFFLVLGALSFMIDMRTGSIVLFLYFLCFVILALFLLLNKLVKKTYWYKNLFIYTNQFVTNSGYRKDLQRNYEIVNLGSNPALFSFFYEEIAGQNWATGSQGPEMDLEILRYYHSYIKEGGIVLIPIVSFSSCTPYLWHYKTNYLGMRYYARFLKVLENGYQASNCIPNYINVKRWIKYPLLFQPKALLYLLNDVQPDNRFFYTDQLMSFLELNKDADHWIECWMHEFDIKDLNAPLDKRMEACHEECADKFAEIAEFCKERGLRPILIFPPMTNVLSSRLSEKAKDTFIYSFVRRIQKRCSVEFLDYMNHKDFISSDLYFNSFFLNLRGRKLFTKRLLKDLNLI